MQPDLLFRIGNIFVLLGWLPLVFVPRWKHTLTLARIVVPAIIALAYSYLIVASFGRAEGSFATLDGVAKLFAVKELLLAGWLHYLAFDLFVGSHVLAEGQAAALPHLLLVPILFLTLMFGPMGYLTFLVIRLAWSKLRPGRVA